MSSPRVRRCLFTLLICCAWATADAQDLQKTLGAQDCAKYYEHRVAHLLGCCGDLELGYQGPTLPVVHSDEQRGKLALKEVQSAIAAQCLQRDSVTSTNLRLDRIGAYLLLASAALHQQGAVGTTDVTDASEYAEKAGYYLREFVRTQPAESRRSWAWIAVAFRRAGEPWKALRFLKELPTECCNKAAVARAEGDLLFQLGLEAQAAAFYGHWLTSEAPSACDWQESQTNVLTLERRGFSVGPDTLGQSDLGKMSVPCVERDDWLPYVRMIADREREQISHKGGKKPK